DRTVSPAEILRMATVNGARALGRRGQIGELRPDAFADLIAIPASGKNEEIYETVLAHDGPVLVSLIDGRWVIPPK
ncbi:MAG: amidohydrolase family protein, partial [Limisphaerales bacterium]